MKTILFALSLLLAGCHTAPRATNPLPDPLPLRGPPGAYTGPAPAEPSPAARSDERTRQLLAALVDQNEALTTRLEALEHAKAQVTPDVPSPSIAVPPAAGTTSRAPARSNTDVAPPRSGDGAAEPPPVPAVPVAMAPVAAQADLPLLTPNADGVIDLTALDAPIPGAPPNPFAVRTLPADAVREIIVNVQGILTGATSCALVGDHIVEPGDTVETLRLARLDPDALVLTGDGFSLRLPFGATKVRLAL